MALQFKTTRIPGTHGPIMYPAPELQLRRGRYWQLYGEYEVMGKNGGRTLTVDVTLHNNFTTIENLRKGISDLEALLGQNGKLIETGTVSQMFEHCTFERYEMIPLEGQPMPGPLQDVAGTLFGDDGEGDGGWFVTLMLYFRQLLAT